MICWLLAKDQELTMDCTVFVLSCSLPIRGLNLRANLVF